MDESKLNINAPLMSVRRSPATSPSLTEAKRKILEKRQSLPYYKSDMTLDRVTEPAAVPFNWEHIPGRRKGKGGSEPQSPMEAAINPSPSLPPGKSESVAKQPLEKECNVANKFGSSNKSNSLSGSVSKIERDKERKEEKIRSNVEEEDDDGVYSDALDTLSPTESFFINCSVSGVSGLDNVDANKSGTFSTDKQTQDFMMSRFLPAAKAMTLQPPQYGSRRESVLVEQPKDVTKLVREEKKSLGEKHTSDIVPYTGQCQDEEEESGDEADDYDDSADISAKGCGLFPRLRVRNSLCLLNPVPGMKIRNQFPMSSAYEFGKPNKSSHIRSYSPAPVIKKAWDAIHKSKSSSGAASPDMQEVRKKWTSESNKYTYSGELKQQGRLSPFRRSRAAAGISPCRSKPQSPFHGTRLLGDSKQAENNQSGRLKFQSRGHGSIPEVLSQGAKRSSNSGNLASEKTLYIDTASTVKLSCSNLSSVDNTQRIGTVVGDLDKRRGKQSNSIKEYSQDIKHLQLQALKEKDKLGCEVLSSLDANSSTLSSMLQLMAKEDKAGGLTSDQEINQEPVSLQFVQGSLDEDTEINNQQIVGVDDSGKVGAEYGLSPLPPPLPKSPSESWLCRALPSVSLKNSFLHSNQGTQPHAERQDFNAKFSHTKWETIVKTSNVQHDHVCYSQELTRHKSQHSKS